MRSVKHCLYISTPAPARERERDCHLTNSHQVPPPPPTTYLTSGLAGSNGKEGEGGEGAHAPQGKLTAIPVCQPPPHNQQPDQCPPLLGVLVRAIGATSRRSSRLDALAHLLYSPMNISTSSHLREYSYEYKYSHLPEYSYEYKYSHPREYSYEY